MERTVTHSTVLVSSLWRVFPITLSSQTDMPSLTTVTLDKGRAFRNKKTVHTKSSSSSSPSFLDITPALQYYLDASSDCCTILSPPSSKRISNKHPTHSSSHPSYQSEKPKDAAASSTPPPRSSADPPTAPPPRTRTASEQIGRTAETSTRANHQKPSCKTAWTPTPPSRAPSPPAPCPRNSRH